MTQVQLIADSGDELGIGELQPGIPTLRGSRYSFAITLSLEAVGGSWDIFHNHLRRTSTRYSWNYEEVNGDHQERVYYFRESAFRYAKVIGAPQAADSFTVTGRDPFTNPVDINFLLKGDRFRAERELTDGRKEVRYGVAHMDGHAISPDHGWLAAEAEGDESTAGAKRVEYGPGSSKQYINVRYDDTAYSDTSARRNASLYLCDGWMVYSTPEVARRKAKVLRDHLETMRQVKEDQELEKAQEQFKKAAATIARIENRRKAK